MKKILASLLAMTMVLTTMSVCVIPVSAIEEATGSNVIFNEDFTGYTKDVNWLANVTDGFVTSTNTGVAENAWTIMGTSTADNASVKVVADPTNASNQVLEINTGTGTPGDDFVTVRKNANGGNAIARSSMQQGKKMVLEGKFYVPATDGIFGNSTMFGYNTGEVTTATDENSLSTSLSVYGSTTLDQRMYLFNTEAGKNSSYVRLRANQGSIVGEWITFKYIIDVSEPNSATHSDTVRMFWNDRHVVGAFGNNSSKYGDSTVNPNYPGYQCSNLNVNNYELNYMTDFWKGMFESETDSLSVGDFYGTTFSATNYKNDTNAPTNQKYYIDDLKAYWIDSFEVEQNGVTNANNWQEGDISITFNNAVKDDVTWREPSGWNSYGSTADKAQTLTDLSDGVREQKEKNVYGANELISIRDKNGDRVNNGILSVALSQDGKTLKVTPNAEVLAKGGDYSIALDPLFRSVDGQGLTNNNTDYLVNFHVKTAGDEIFTENFDIGYQADVNWLANVTDGFVTSANTGVAEKAWTIMGTSTKDNASVKVVADPTNANNKVLEINAGTGTATDDYVTVRRNADAGNAIARATMQQGKKLVYEAKLYIPGENNIIGNATVFGYSNGNVTAALDENNALSTYLSPYDTTDQVMYYFNTGSAKNSSYVRLRANRPSSVTDGSDIVGEWITFKYIIDVSEENSATHSDTVRMFVNDRQVVGAFGNNSSKYGDSTVNPNYPGYQCSNLNVNNYELNYMTDFWKGQFTAADSSISVGDFYGTTFSATNYTTLTNGKYYIDDLKAYWIDSFEVAENGIVNANNWVEGDVSLTFNNAVKNDVTWREPSGWNSYGSTADKAQTLTDLSAGVREQKEKYVYGANKLISIRDKNGDRVNNGILSVALSEDGKTLKVTPNKEVLVKGEAYSISIDPLFRSVDGQALTNNNTEYAIPFSVSKYSSLYAVAEDATISGNTVSTSLSFVNPKESSLPVWCVIAVYGEYNEMLGCSAPIATTIDAGQTTTPQPVTVNVEDGSKILSVRMHVWNSATDMLAYHQAEILYTAPAVD